MSQILVELQDIMGNDRSIAEAAWTSSLGRTAKLKRSDDDVKRVINLLADQKHSVPFESIIFRFWLKLPIAIDRQLMTHRLQSASGMSARYRRMPIEYLDLPEDVDNIIKKFEQNGEDFFQRYYDICEEANNFYSIFCNQAKIASENLIINNDEYKRVREFFRGILPQHNMTERISIMNLRSWANFYKLRSDKHAQPEIQQIANLMFEAIKASNKIPFALEALERNNWSI